MFWGGLKAGKDPKDSGKELIWREEEVLKGQKWCDGLQVSLTDALKQGHHSSTAHLLFFAKTRLLLRAQEGQQEAESRSRFFKVTNVIRLGYKAADRISPVIREADFLKAVEPSMDDYCSAHPNALKFAA